MNNFLTEIIISFFIGGVILASITYLVKYLKPAVAALVWASPIILLPSVLILWCNSVPNKTIGSFVYISMPYLLLTLIWQVSFILLLKNTKYLDDKNGVIKTIIISLIVWVIFAIVFYYSNIHKYLKLD